MEEQVLGLHPLLKDTDDDGIGDNDEVNAISTTLTSDAANSLDPGVRRVGTFDGDDYLVAYDNETIGLETFMITLWVKPDLNGSHTILEKHARGDNNDVLNYALRLLPDGTVIFEYHNQLINRLVTLESRDTIGAGEWAMIAATLDIANNNMQLDLFVPTGPDTFDQRTNSRLPISTPVIETGHLYVGVDYNGVTQSAVGSTHYSGQMDDITIWEDILTAAQLQEIYLLAREGNSFGAFEIFDTISTTIVDDAGAVTGTQVETIVVDTIEPVLFYSFNDGGQFVEDFAHPRDWLNVSSVDGYNWRYAARVVGNTFAGEGQLDNDGDGLPNWFEMLYSENRIFGLGQIGQIDVDLNPNNADTDNDGIRDGAEDIDRDGLTNMEEYLGRDSTIPQIGIGVYDDVSSEWVYDEVVADAIRPTNPQIGVWYYVEASASGTEINIGNEWQGQIGMLAKFDGTWSFVEPVATPNDTPTTGDHYVTTINITGPITDRRYENTDGTIPTVADTDGDSLLDGAELNTYGSDPLLVDSDDDGLDDETEIAQGDSPTSSLDPLVRRSLRLGAGGYMQAIGQARHELDSFTVEAWVYPDAANADGVVVRKVSGRVDRRDLTFANNDPLADTITTAGGDFITAGMAAGMTITVEGSLSNNGSYEIAEVTPTVLTLAGGETLANEAPSNSRVQLVADAVNYELGLRAGFPYVSYTPDNLGENQEIVGTDLAELGEWTHIAGTLDPDAGRLILYVNGRSQSVNFTGFKPYQKPGDLYIGAVSGGFEGLIDEVRVWSVARSTAQINGLKDSTLAATEDGLSSYFRMDDGEYGTSNPPYEHKFGAEDHAIPNDFTVAALGRGDYAFDTVVPDLSDMDSDNDGMPDFWENANGLDPFDATGDNGATGDPDNDGLLNLQEYDADTNPQHRDTDADGMDDGFEVLFSLLPKADDAFDDADGDGLNNISEFLGADNQAAFAGSTGAILISSSDRSLWGDATDPTSADSDGDAMGDKAEVENDLDPNDASGDNGADGDPDADDLTNIRELQLGTKPTVADTDGDSLKDGWEVANSFDPLNNDTDGDGTLDGEEDTDNDALDNAGEQNRGTEPRNPDTDGDLLPDGWEVISTNSSAVSLDPLDATGIHGTDGDPDEDGRTNRLEYLAGTDPWVADNFDVDTDNDDVADTDEIQQNTDRQLPDTDDDGIADIVEHNDAELGFLSDPLNSLKYKGVQNLVLNLDGATFLDVPLVNIGQSDANVAVEDDPDAQRLGYESWTVEAWVRPQLDLTLHADPDRRMVIVQRSLSLNGDADVISYELGIDTDERPYVLWSTPTVVRKVKAGTPIQSADENFVWTHILGTFNAANNSMFLYVNGVEVARNINAFGSAKPKDLDKLAVIRIGASVDVDDVSDSISTHNFVGDLDEVRIWGDVRTEAEIKEAYNRDVEIVLGNLDTFRSGLVPQESVYDPGIDSQLSTDGLWETTAGTQGLLLAQARYFDANLNQTRDAHEGLWIDQNGNNVYDEPVLVEGETEETVIDTVILPGSHDPTVTVDENAAVVLIPDFTVASDDGTLIQDAPGSLAALYFGDTNSNATWEATEDMWDDYVTLQDAFFPGVNDWATPLNLGLYLKFDDGPMVLTVADQAAEDAVATTYIGAIYRSDEAAYKVDIDPTSGRNWVVNPVTPTIQDFVWHADWLPYERLLSQSLVDTDRWVHALQLTTATNARATLVQANDEPNVMNLIVDIDPQSPGVDSVLTAHPRGAFDPNGDMFSYEYQWYIDDAGCVDTTCMEPIADATARHWTVQAGSRSYRVSVRAVDEDGGASTWVWSEAVTVDAAQSSPTVAEYVVSQADLDEDERAEHYIGTLTTEPTDADGDQVHVFTRWIKNQGIAITDWSLMLVDLSYGHAQLRVGDVVKLEAYVTDEVDGNNTATGRRSAPSYSNSFVHGGGVGTNSRPEPPAIAIEPAQPRAEDDDIRCVLTLPAVDPDGDVVSYFFEWYGFNRVTNTYQQLERRSRTTTEGVIETGGRKEIGFPGFVDTSVTGTELDDLLSGTGTDVLAPDDGDILEGSIILTAGQAQVEFAIDSNIISTMLATENHRLEGVLVYCEVQAVDTFGNRSEPARSQTVTVFPGFGLPGSNEDDEGGGGGGGGEGTSSLVIDAETYEPNDTPQEARRILVNGFDVFNSSTDQENGSGGGGGGGDENSGDQSGGFSTVEESGNTNESNNNSGSDTENTEEEGNSLSLEGTFEGQAHSFFLEDEDWMKFTVLQTSEVEVATGRTVDEIEQRIRNPARDTGTRLDLGVDTRMWLYSEGDFERAIIFNDDYRSFAHPEFNLAARFKVVVDPGTYYIRVAPHHQFGTLASEYGILVLANPVPGVFVSSPAQPVLRPTNAQVTDDLFADVDPATVLSGHQLFYRWYVDGVQVMVTEDRVLDHRFTQAGQEWAVSVFARNPAGEVSADSPLSVEVEIEQQAWLATLRVDKRFGDGSEAPTQTVGIGWLAGASHGWDENLDVDLPTSLNIPAFFGNVNGPTPLPDGTSVPSGSFFSAGFTEGHSALSLDMRPFGDAATWYLYLDFGDQPTEVRIEWDPILLPRSDLPLTWVEVDPDSDFAPIPGTELDMLAERRVGIDISGNTERTTRVFRVMIAQSSRTVSLTLDAGWNLISFPITPNDPDPDLVFANNTGRIISGAAWTFLNGSYIAATEIRAGEGYWVLNPRDIAATIVVGGYHAPLTIVLKEGWNLIGPTRDMAVPDGIDPSKVSEYSRGSYRPLDLTDPLPLKAGKGYWVNSDQERVIHFE